MRKTLASKVMPRKSKSTGTYPSPLPAHETKHHPQLTYPFLDKTFSLKQLNDGQSNGTGLWLGSQCLSLYLSDIEQSLLKSVKARRKVENTTTAERPPRAIELGSGIGLGALALSSSGWDVLATDTDFIVRSVLQPNVTTNTSLSSGRVRAKELDWTTPPLEWRWDNPSSVTCSAEKEAINEVDDIAMPTIDPPFDLIISSDTIFSAELAPCLLRTMAHLSKISRVPPASAETPGGKAYYPPVYLAIENRDPLLVAKTLNEAREEWGFGLTRVPHTKVSATLKTGGVDWDEEEWEGVEIWVLTL
ncbi:hypothetical protein FRB99_006953 [Tulasnella sp. 403]|nr:hypothetical protein FRB99_006953 [Tulasnella sp. 403]